jgi:hypothetical protein
MDLREIDLRGVDWIRLAQDRDRWLAVVSAVMNLRVLAPRSYSLLLHRLFQAEMRLLVLRDCICIIIGGWRAFRHAFLNVACEN